MKIAAVLVLLATIASSTAVAATTRARVAVTSTAPVTVDGTGFRSRERVTVTLIATDMHRKVVIAGARGVFTAKFAGTTIGDCQGYFIRAKGNRGSLAVFRLVPECAPQGPAG